MVKIRFIPNQRALDNYYHYQTGGGTDHNFFSGAPYQRGHGLGGIFGRLFRAAVPVFKSAGKSLAREALSTGVGVAGDLLDGGNIKGSLESRLPAAGKRLAVKGVRKLNTMLNSHPPKSRKRKRSLSHKTGKRRKNIKGSDIFS